MTEISLYQWLIECKLFAPYQRIGQCIAIYLRIGLAPYAAYPVEVFTIIDIGNFRFIHVERGDCHTARNSIPVERNILLREAHNESTARNQNKIGTGLLTFVVDLLFETAPLRIIILPAGDSR